MYKNIYKILCLTMFVFIIAFPSDTLAKPVHVLECPDDDDAECLENISKLDEIESEEEQVLEVKKSESIFLKILQTFFALLIVLALIYLLLKFLGNRNKLFTQVKSLENIGGISIGQNKSIQLVRVGSNIYMIGVGENVELLEEITDQQLKDDLLHKNEENEFQVNNLFSAFTKMKPSKKNKPTSDKTNNQFKEMFSSELTKLKQTRTKIQDQQKQKDDRDE